MKKKKQNKYGKKKRKRQENRVINKSVAKGATYYLMYESVCTISNKRIKAKPMH